MSLCNCSLFNFEIKWQDEEGNYKLVIKSITYIYVQVDPFIKQNNMRAINAKRFLKEKLIIVLCLILKLNDERWKRQ